MSSDLHPEALIDRESRLDPREQARLEQHRATCGACRLEAMIRREFAPGRHEPTPRDREVAARVVARIFDPASIGLPPRKPRRWTATLIAAAVALLMIGGAAAAFFGSNASPTPRTLSTEPRPAAETTPTAPITTDRAGPAPTLPSPPASPPRSQSEPVDQPRGERTQRRAHRPRASASDLFVEGNRARREGEVRRAADRYRTLVRQYPQSREASAARITLGFLLLRQLQRPAEALALFERYLADGGTMSEEAHLGRALTLARLHRPAEEARAWREMLSAHPRTVHRQRAQQRLDSLGVSPVP